MEAQPVEQQLLDLALIASWADKVIEAWNSYEWLRVERALENTPPAVVKAVKRNKKEVLSGK